MRNQKPPFEITNQIIDYVAEIAELVGRLTVFSPLSTSPTLRRANRIRTIHGSLSIEQNTLTLEQVTAVLNGKHVLAPPKDIAEVKNAYEIYERLDELDPYSVDDLLTAHGIMTRGLVEESGIFRTRPVGVVDSEGHVLHFGTLPPACGCGGQRGACPAFWHSAAVCPGFGHGTAGLGKDQRGTHAHPQLRIPL